MGDGNIPRYNAAIEKGIFEIRIPNDLNLALCYLKMEEYYKGIRSTSRVIGIGEILKKRGK